MVKAIRMNRTGGPEVAKADVSVMQVTAPS